MKPLARQDVLDRILDSAEELFAKHGYDGASLRSITHKAGVNLAAAHYHLGDKKTLYFAVITRRMRPINELRMAMLQQAEEAANGYPVPVTVIMEIMVRPLFELCQGKKPGNHHFLLLVGRSLTDPLPFMDELHTKEFHPALACFGQALRRQAPGLSPEEFLWRLSFVIGALHHTLSTLHYMRQLTHGICRDNDQEGALQRFISFAVSAFTAPAPQRI